MAKVYLGANESFTLSNSATVVGGSGTEKVLLASGANNVFLDVAVERAELTGNLSSYTFSIAGNIVTVRQAGTVVATITAANQTLAFADGSAALSLTGFGTATLGGAAVPASAAPVAATLNTSDKSTVGTGTPTGPTGYTLSASADVVVEGNTLTFTVTRTDATAEKTLSFNVAGDTNGGSVTAATAGTDATPASGSVVFAAGATTATFTVAATSDFLVEGLEGLKISLFDGVTSVASKVVLINDDLTVTQGQNFTLTGNIDSGALFTGGAGNDTFNGTVVGNNLTGTTLQAGDVLNGGTGTDTLTISVSGATAGATFNDSTKVNAVTLNGIEKVAVNNFNTQAMNATVAAVVVDASLFDASLTTLALSASSTTAEAGNTGFVNVKKIVNAEMSNGGGSLGIQYVGTAVVGAADAMTLTVSNQTGGLFQADGIETINVVSNTSANTVTLASTTLKTVNVTGAADLNIGALAATVTKVDASAFTGGLSLTAGQVQDYNIVGGAGNDAIAVTVANLTVADTINAGLGTDTLKLDDAITSAQAANISGFEVLEAAGASKTYDVAALNATTNTITKLVASSAAAATFVNVGAGVTDIAVTNTNSVTASLKTDTAADAVTVTYGKLAAGSVAASGVTAGGTTLNDYETISIVSQGAANNTGAFASTSVKTLNASGATALTLGTITGGLALATINAAGMTANFTMTNNLSDVASTITGGAGNDTLLGSTKVDSIVGGAGNDTITGAAGADLLDGGAGNDTFIVTTLSDFTTGVETVIGGAGNDTLSFNTPATAITLSAANLGAISGIETLSLNSTSAASSVTLTDAVFTANGQTLAIVDGDLTQGTLTVNGAALSAANVISVTANTSTGVNDTLTGGAGNDSFTFAGTTGLEATDTVVGGAGTDTIFLTATAAVTANLTGVRTVENITTTGTGGNISIVVGSDSVIGASGTLTVNASSSTTSANTLNYDGSAITTTVTNRVQNVTGSAGADTIVGGSGSDILSGGTGNDVITGGVGTDNLSGGAGDDRFVVNAAAEFATLSTVETVSGGAGNDVLDFTYAAVTVNASDLLGISGIEQIKLSNAAAASSITLTDAVYTANGATSLIIDAQYATSGSISVAAGTLSAANSLVVYADKDGTALGANSTITGGAGNDTIWLDAPDLASASTIAGGLGTDTLKIDQTGTVTLVATITGFEILELVQDAVYGLTTVDANVAAGATLTVNGAALIGGTNALTFNGAAELDGKFSVTGGAGNDVLTGGALADTIIAGAGNDTIVGGLGADVLTGGAGADVFNYTLVTQSSGSTIDTITDFATTVDKLAFTLDYTGISAGVDVNTNIVATVGDLSAKRGEFFYDATAGQLSVNVNNDNLITTQDYKVAVGTVVAADVNFTITGSAFGDTIVGGAGADIITGGEGADTITIGRGQDTVTLTETVAAADTLIFSTAFAAGNANAATITGFANAAGVDLFDIGFALGHGTLTFAAGTGATATIAASTPVTVTDNGTTTANTGVVFLLSGANDQMAGGTTIANAVANAVTALTSTADFAASNVAAGDSLILVLDDNVNSFVFHYVADAANTVTSAADLQLIGIVNGVADAGSFLVGDFI